MFYVLIINVQAIYVLQKIFSSKFHLDQSYPTVFKLHLRYLKNFIISFSSFILQYVTIQNYRIQLQFYLYIKYDIR